MSKISKYQDPIELVHECRDKNDDDYGYEMVTHINTDPMDFSDITNLLNDYEVSYRGMPFTNSILRRIQFSKLF